MQYTRRFVRPMSRSSSDVLAELTTILPWSIVLPRSNVDGTLDQVPFNDHEDLQRKAAP
jgi:hypothetical protein